MRLRPVVPELEVPVFAESSALDQLALFFHDILESCVLV